MIETRIKKAHRREVKHETTTGENLELTNENTKTTQERKNREISRTGQNHIKKTTPINEST